MEFIPTISDFVSEKSFAKLQFRFSNYDEQNHYGNDNQETNFALIQGDFEIIYKSRDESYNEVYNKVYFYNDFLRTRVFEIAQVEIDLINKRIENEFQYNHHERRNFIDHQIELYRDYDQKIFGSIFLPEKLKIDLISQTTKILEFLFEDIILKDIFKKEDKMKIKMNRNDIQMLFFLLRQAKLVDHTYDADLGRCIDNFFLYFNLETNEYTEIKKSNKDLSDYKNNSKTVEKSMDRLKSIFMNESLYKINL